ncbi:MAG: NAD(P)/FAD-dependent oxidoreductase [Candidatus Rifleibacteriota bacterium]
MKVAVIGGGAAGFFAAICIKENYPSAEVTIFEKSVNILRKVKVSGGGRCNLTNGCKTIKELCSAYPRGANHLKKAFKTFDNHDAMQWLKTKGVKLTVQEDGCVFPASQNSQTVIDCFFKLSEKLKIQIKTKSEINSIIPAKGRVQLSIKNKSNDNNIFDKVVVAVGGISKREKLNWLEKLGHKIEPPVPSLFTFNMPNEAIKDLMGIVVENAIVSLEDTNIKTRGPVLITHWGMSGPAILKASAFGARLLHNKNYDFKIHLNWPGIEKTEIIRNKIRAITTENAKKNLTNYRPFNLPDRLWRYLLKKLNFAATQKWNELGKKNLNRLVEVLSNDIYRVQGQSAFREEFVTCGGVSLKSINIKTMQSRKVPGLYFAGEVLDIDGITGGFNFQAAWTTAFIAAKLE